jgi:hypothetical protein
MLEQAADSTTIQAYVKTGMRLATVDLETAVFSFTIVLITSRDGNLKKNGRKNKLRRPRNFPLQLVLQIKTMKKRLNRRKMTAFQKIVKYVRRILRVLWRLTAGTTSVRNAS